MAINFKLPLSPDANGKAISTHNSVNPYLLKIYTTDNESGITYDGHEEVTVDTTVASKLGTSNLGSGTQFIYLNSGVATASTSTVGGLTTPVYLDAGIIKACTSLGESAYHADSYFALYGHTHATTIATSSATNQITLAANTKYSITAGGTTYVFTTPPDSNTWRGIQDNLTSNSTTDSLSAAQGKALKTLIDGKAASGHTHDVSIAADSGTTQLTMAANTKYKLTAGGKTFIFTTPPDNNTWRGIQDNLTSTSTTDSLSAAQGKALKDLVDGKADSGHNHTLSIVSDSGTSQINLSASTTYKITAGGSTYIFKTPPGATYSAGTGISFSGTTINNSGVRSIATGSTNGTISVNTNGTSSDVAVKGLGSLAYLSSLTYSDVGAAAAGHTHNTYVLKAGDTMTGSLTVKELHGTANIDYGSTLPLTATEGQIFFQVSDPWYEIPPGGTTGQALIKHSKNIYVENNVLFGAAWNDYAEYRETENYIEPGRCIIEKGDGTLILSTERLQPGAEIVSDTFGFAIGQTEKCNTPIAVSGRVLAYFDGSIEDIKIGSPVCSGPNGTVSQMTEDEARCYPWLIIGTISSIPQEKKWGANNTWVNGRIWIRVR